MTTIILFNSLLISVVVYSSESWNTTETRHIENSRLRHIFRIQWPDTMSYEELHRGSQETIASEIIIQT
jgi:protein-tyrosine phosphatase